MRNPIEDRGFSLVEVLVAMALLAVMVTGLAAVIVLAVRVGAGAEEQTMAATLAAQKLEELRSSLGGTVPTPAGSLQTDVPGYVEWLDHQGQPIGASLNPSAVYVRRWVVGPLPGTSDNGLLQVLVSSVVRDRSVAGGAVRRRHANEALLATFIGRR
jgi:prepilin-type N-terminal cleavage/methylation domain-containing protein